MIPFDLLLITDPEATGGVVAAIRAALDAVPPGRAAVQLRDRSLPAGELLALARDLREVTRERGALLLINDRVDVAQVAEADGVHLPERGIAVADARRLLGDGAVIGVSRHERDGIVRADAEGASYAVLGPWASVSGKGDGIGAGVFAAAVAGATVPVLALGGITPALVGAALRSGASGVAVMRGVSHAPDPGAAAEALVRALDIARPGGDSGPK